MLHKTAKSIQIITRHILVFALIFTWVFSSWPHLFPQFPPKTEEVKAQAQGTGWYDAAWAYRKKLTVNQSKVAGSATSFPVLVSATSTDWKYTVHGGYVATVTGSDILFTSSDGITKLDHEIESYASSTGKLAAWVRLPYLSSATTNAIFIYYGNAAAADQSNKTGVWDSNFKGVWHMSATSSQTTITYDSTANSNTGTKFATNEPFSSSTGTINGAQTFDGNDDRVNTVSTNRHNMTSNFAVSAWIYPKNLTGYKDIMARMDVGTSGACAVEGSQHNYYLETFGTELDVGFCSVGGVINDHITTGAALSLNTWTHVGAVFDDTGDTVQFYINGVPFGSAQTETESPQDLGARQFIIGAGFPSENWAGKIDEVRISNAVRSATWIKTEYNNQSSPETFFIMGNQESQWCSYNDSSWNYRKKITVAASKVAGAQTNFPVLVNRTDVDFKHTNFGGHVSSATGYDFVFTSSDCSVKYDHEIEKFASSTGELVAWVRYPFLSTTSTNSLYVYYGGPTTLNQQNVHGVWDNNFAGVWHLAEKTGSHYDSTANSNTSTVIDVQSQGTATGKINGADDFELESTDNVDTADSSSLDINSNVTLSAWIRKESNPAGFQNILFKGIGNYYLQSHGDELDVGFAAAGNGGECESTGVNFNTSDFYYVIGVFDNDLDQFRLYVNGNEVAAIGTFFGGCSPTGNPVADSADLEIGQDGDNSDFFDGIIDEPRVSNAVRSATWIATEYNNQSSPSTFLSFDTEDPLRGAYIDHNDILSDSRPVQTSNHTLQFIINNDITASTSLVFSWPDGFSMSAPTNWYSGNWSYRKKITIDGTKIAGNTDLTDFPVLVSSTQALWKSSGNGGNVSSATGWDFVFTKADGVTKLDHEIEKFASTTGELVAWFRAPTLDRNAANEFYIYYGGPATTDQQNKFGVWDSNYKGVWHLAETSGTSNFDSTITSNTGTKLSATEPYSVTTGTINGAQNFDGVDDFDNIGNPTSLQLTSNMTLSGWIKADVHPADDGNIIAKQGLSGSRGWQLKTTIDSGPRTVSVAVANDGSTFAQREGSTVLAVDVWYHAVGVYNASQQTLDVYLNGILDNGPLGGTVPSSQFNNSENVNIGRRPTGTLHFDGIIDELRVSNVARSAAWIQTEYNNQSSPSTFHTIGNEEDNGVYDCGDVDVATGTEFTLGGVNDCWATASHWGVIFATSSRKLTITAPTNEYTHVATGTQITVQFGTNATSQLQGNSRMTNPSSAGIYKATLTGTAGSVGNFLASINEGQLVSAVISESLAFTVNPVDATNWYNASWGYRQLITLDSASGTLGHVNFPVLINSTDVDWKHTANGGHVGVTTGKDFVFTAADGITKLDHEIEKFASTTGELIAWLRYPFLASTSTNDLYIYYGNAASADQQNARGVWDANYRAVWHLDEQTGSHYDSTANSNTSTAIDVQLQGTAAGQIDGADDFEETSNDVVDIDDNTSRLDLSSSFTISAWIRKESNVNYDIIIAKGNSADPDYNYWLDTNGDEVTMGFTKQPVYNECGTTAANLNTTDAYYVVGVFDDANNVQRIYVNGATATVATVSGQGCSPTDTLDQSNDQVNIGNDRDNGQDFDGIIDEPRIAATVRTGAWIASEFNNQSSPSTFYSMGDEQTQAGAGCSADDGASITAITATATTVPFGAISFNAFYQGCQDLEVSTNAGGGYSLTSQENRPMTAGSSIIPDTTCNTGTCTEVTSAAWTTATNNGLGHTCVDSVGGDCNSVYNDGDNFRQFANMSGGETAQAFMSSTTPAIATGRIKFRLSAGSGQAAGTYSNIVSYVLTATY